ncbi:MAG: grpE [Flavipsychrobacter sp.]|nr:grpE [Flavipsychrobacter sp.]
MSDNKDNRTNGTADNMSQNNEAMEDALANELNVDDSVSGMQHLDDEMTDESELEKLQSELDDAKDKYIRLVAEFDNFRKRNAKERLELIATAGRDIVQSLLEVLDDMERAEKQMESTEDLKAIKEGVMLVFNKLRNTLQQKGLKAAESKNQPFNPDMHEAITEIPVPDEEMKGKIIDEVEKAYYLNDKLIRYAKVVVGK